jgi:predicted NACHT family NTPase
MVILGESGSGKSVLVQRLTLDLLGMRTSSDPVPILFSISNWNLLEPFDRWLAVRLETEYQPLTRTVQSTSGTQRSLAAEIIAPGRVLPILDGFDEIPEQFRDRVLETMNRAFGRRYEFALTSRTAAYEDAVSIRAHCQMRL